MLAWLPAGRSCPAPRLRPPCWPMDGEAAPGAPSPRVPVLLPPPPRGRGPGAGGRSGPGMLRSQITHHQREAGAAQHEPGADVVPRLGASCDLTRGVSCPPGSITEQSPVPLLRISVPSGSPGRPPAPAASPAHERISCVCSSSKQAATQQHVHHLGSPRCCNLCVRSSLYD